MINVIESIFSNIIIRFDELAEEILISSININNINISIIESMIKMFRLKDHNKKYILNFFLNLSNSLLEYITNIFENLLNNNNFYNFYND